MKFCKKHIYGIFFSLLVGFVIIVPQIALIHNLGSRYKGFYALVTADEPYYVARINSVYRGGDGTKNPYIYEARNEPGPAYDLSEFLLALPGRLLGASATDMNLAYKFILPTIAAFLWYLLAFRLLRNKLWSIAITTTIFLAYPLFVDFSTLHNLLTWNVPFTDFLRYARPVNPQFSSIFFAGYLNLLLYTLQKRTTQSFIYMGLWSGLSFYIYFFLSIFILALHGMALIFFFVQRDRNLAKKFLLAIGIGLIIGSYFAYHSYLVTKNSLYHTYGIQPTHSHSFHLEEVAIFTYALFALYLIVRRRQDREFGIDIQLLSLLLVTTFIVMNEQVLTGIELQYGHYHWYFNVPVYILTLFFILREWLHEWQQAPLLRYIVPVVGIAVAVFWGFFTQLSTYLRIDLAAYIENQNRVPLFEKLSSLPMDSVIFANNEISELIPAFTHQYVVWAHPSIFYMVPPERADFNQENLLSSGFDLKKFGDYRLDYLVWDTKTNPEWKIDQYASFEEIGQTGNLKLYKNNE